MVKKEILFSFTYSQSCRGCALAHQELFVGRKMEEKGDSLVGRIAIRRLEFTDRSPTALRYLTT